MRETVRYFPVQRLSKRRIHRILDNAGNGTNSTLCVFQRYRERLSSGQSLFGEGTGLALSRPEA